MQNHNFFDLDEKIADIGELINILSACSDTKTDARIIIDKLKAEYAELEKNYTIAFKNAILKND